MKIFPSTHKIKSITDGHVDLDLNVPLAFIELDYSKYKIDKITKPIASQDIKKEVILNQAFDSPNIKLFNKFGEAVNMDNLLTRVGNKYYYRPKEIITFEPQKFKYDATIKKKLSYKISNSYNINIACVDDPDSLDLSQRIASGFSNPSAREIVPPNISINNNRIDAQAFSDMSLNNCDILFIESPDGKHYDDSLNPIEIDKTIFLNNDTTIWLASDFNLKYPHENEAGGRDFEVQNPILNSKIRVNSSTYFDINAMPYDVNVIYHNLFVGNYAPVLIIEHIGKGYEIISSTEILKNIPSNIQLMYECIMYCYLNSYKKTEELSQWIASEVPDYQIESGKLAKKQYFVSDIDLYSYFNIKSSEADLYSVNIKSDTNVAYDSSTDLYEPNSAINFIGMTGGRLMFNKTASNSSPYKIEPEKPIGWISIYDGNNINYIKELHYIIETDLNSKIFTVVNDNDLAVKILAFKSTSLGIDTKMPVDKLISFIKTEVNSIERIREAEYLFYIDPNNQNIDFVFIEDYKEELGIALFTIKVYQTSDSINITDMRQLGGGLVEDAADNYNLMDIGHINGRPYRQAGTIVFTLPTKYKPYETNILKAIKKYISASEVPVILFEDTIQ